MIRREYNSQGFYGVLQMVNYLAQQGIAIATPKLRQWLERLKKGAGKLRVPAPLPGESEQRRRHPVKKAERADGTVQFFNNGQLAVVLAHWLRNRGREDREITVKLFGYHQPPHLPGKPKPRAKRDRCKLYDLRHAWALRAKATTSWSTAVKAASMGHSEAVHASRNLGEERAEHKLSHLPRARRSLLLSTTRA